MGLMIPSLSGPLSLDFSPLSSYKSPPPLITTQGTSGGGVKAWLTIHKPFNIPLRPVPSGDVSHPKGAHIHPSWSHKALPFPSIQTTARLK